ncbi:MAG: RDD family protein [Pseudomonadota bacterium]
MTNEVRVAEPSEGSLQIAGFWARILAFCIDFLVLGLVGFCMGLLWSDYFVRVGGWGRAIGFVVALAYFGFMNSRIFGGQTVGKRALKLRVASTHGADLSLSSSCVRASVLCIPFFLNNAAINLDVLQTGFMYLLSMLVFGGGLSIVYLYICNRKTRQSLHDLLVGSVVVKAASSRSSTLAASPWRGHLVVATVIMLISLAGPGFAMKLLNAEPFASLIPLQKALASEPGVTAASVNAGSTWSKSMKEERKTHTYLTAGVMIASKNVDYDSLANRLAGIILSDYPGIAARDMLTVSVIYGYDIGIFSASQSVNFSYTPAQWRERLTAKSSAS